MSHQAQQLPIDTTHVVVAVGSLGDVLPLLQIAQALQQRGCVVAFLSAQRFAKQALQYGVPFVPILSELEAAQIMDNPLLWHPQRGIRVLWEGVLRGAQATLRLLADFAQRSDKRLTLVGGTMAVGLRVAHERWGWPHVGIQVSPCWTFSSHVPPVFAGLQWLHRLPIKWRGKVWAWVDKNLLDAVFLPGLNAWRAELGLPAVERMLGKWSASPQRVVGLYPTWFAPLQPDSPSQIQLADFVLPDVFERVAVAPDVAAFLDAPGDTVLFMAGSDMQHAKAFFDKAALVTAQLGLKALFVMPDAAASHAWGPHVLRQAHIALMQVLPRCKAMVSHAGIGTIAHGLAAGVPMLLVPYAFDQFDNAKRTCDLGVARQLHSQASPATLKAALNALMHSPEVQQALHSAQSRMRSSGEALQLVCDQILGEKSMVAQRKD
jgi:rhamnosyltransferase subunit B